MVCCRTCTRAQCGLMKPKKWSVAMIHIPKTAGSSIAEALWAGRHHACASYTGNLSLCNCKDTRCRSVAKVAVVEAPHRMVKALLGPMRREWLGCPSSAAPRTGSTVRWGSGGAAAAPEDRRIAGADAATLRKASWFDPNAGRDRQASGEEKDGVKYALRPQHPDALPQQRVPRGRLDCGDPGALL